MITLNKGQEEASSLIQFWYELGRDDKQVFVLTGYAGTGKTFLVNHVINDILKLDPEDVAYVAPTGKAASVLIQRGAKNACTIHRLIYTLVEKEVCKISNGKQIRYRTKQFIKKDRIKKYKLIVLDEASMVDAKIMEDLLSFKIPVLAIGDLGQLPAINGQNKILDEPDYNLTEIVRQEENNAIVKLAERARNKLPIELGNYGNVIVTKKELLSEKQLKNILLKADQVLCGSNYTRRKLNKQIKEYLGLDTTKINQGEKIICLLNNWEKYVDIDGEYSLVNGLIGNAMSFSDVDPGLNLGEVVFKPEFIDEYNDEPLLYDTSPFAQQEFRYAFHDSAFLLPGGKYILREPYTPKKPEESQEEYNKRIKNYVLTKKQAISEEQINFFDSAYAITIWKAQGSEWDNVVFFAEEKCCPTAPEKFLYTGITRAKKNLIIIK